MKPHFLIYLILSVFLFSCKDADTDTIFDKGLIKTITVESSVQPQKFSFIYNADGKLQSLNDTIYTYGSNGKIISSSYKENKETGGYKYEKEIRKSYMWDSNGRIRTIVIDKNFEKISSPAGDLLTNNPVPRIEAHFYYTNNNNLPDSIGENFSKDDKIITVKRIYHRDENIIKEELISAVYIVGLGNVNQYVSSKKEFSYDGVKNHLQPLFNDIGVLPRQLGYVTSKNSPSRVIETNYLIENNVNGSNVINKISNYDYSYKISSNGYPSIISTTVAYSNVGTNKFQTYLFY